MAMNPFFLIPVVGILAWAMEASAKTKRSKESNRRKYGITFENNCSSATIWDSDDARAYRDQVILDSMAAGIDDSETIYFRWMDEVAPGCLVNWVQDDAVLTDVQAALYVRFWDSILDTMYDSKLIDEASYDMQSEWIWDFMENMGLSAEFINEAPIVVKG